jgi:hypothetical protein
MDDYSESAILEDDNDDVELMIRKKSSVNVGNVKS